MDYAAQERGKQVIKQYERLKEVRAPLDEEYRQCYRYTVPTLGVGFNNEGSDGISAAVSTKNDQAMLLDTTGTDAVRLLSCSVQSSLTPANSMWFNLEVDGFPYEDLDQESKEYLEDSAQYIHTLIHASNYDTEAPEFMRHSVIAGMAGLYMELKDGKYRFETWPLNHLYCQEVLHNGYIDTVYRSFDWNVQEAVNEFGLERLPQNMQDAFKNDPYSTKKYRFVVTIRPRMKGGKQSSGRTQKNLPWESLWVAPCGTIVRESGFHEMPVVIPRWMRIPDTDYARGPVSDALPDIKSLNAVKEAMHENMAMHISGIFKAKDDGAFNPSKVKIGPRRIVMVQDMDNLQPLKTGGDIQFAMNEIQGLQGSIRRVLLADQLGPTDKAIQTATEVQTRNNQVRQILGPIFARFQSEFLSPLVERCFGLAMRNGLVGQVPDGLRNRVLNIKYRSPLARSQKLQELEAMDQYLNRLIQTAANTQKPELLDRFNFDKAMQKAADLLGVDPEVMNDDQAVSKIRNERRKAQQAAQQQAQQQAMAEAVAKAPPAEVREPAPAV